jgi:primary-amine oxidase
MEVLEVEDHGILPIPAEDGNYSPHSGVKLRADVRSLDIVQPEGPSFSVEGWGIRWQDWKLRLGFTPREGLVLHSVKYFDQNRERSILHRASFSELFVPYGDTGPGSFRRNAFDIGEVGLGQLTNSLELGCDCLGTITYFDVAMVDDSGRPYTIPNAICLHEEDVGLLWKHTDTHTGKTEVRRSRRLVVSSIATADNYEYAFYWYLYQDGTIECEVKLTGIVLTAGIADDELPRYGRLIAPGVVATNHQHFFNVRLDFDIDGRTNTACEVHAEPASEGENPYGNAFRRVKTPLRREVEDLRHRAGQAVSRRGRRLLADARLHQPVRPRRVRHGL